ncbi:MAG TPA: TetR family transcriptional regulator, partial [Herpetosiphonaceae bacterium]
MKTKTKIAEAALALFNEQGTAAVSTNHIAEAAGISPGNLYYHFRSKDEIIRALFDQLSASWDAAFALDGGMPGLADLERMVRANFEVMWRFRFFYRELIVLLRRDQGLRENFAAIRRRGLADFALLV